MDDANPLGAFLRARREQVQPEQAGITTVGQRRTPGLRREEVATRAGISADYYLRIEQGRERNPSAQVLEAVARALLLDQVESAYLLSLTRSGTTGRPRPTDRVPQGVLHLLEELQSPAFVENRYLEVLAANRPAIALSPNLRPGVNRLLAAFLDPQEPLLHGNWEEATAAAVGQLRSTIGAATDDPRAVALVGELSMRSERFRRLWARQEVAAPAGATVVLHHPEVGDLRLFREKLAVGGAEGQVLVIYHAEQGSPAAEGLRLLGSIAATTA